MKKAATLSQPFFILEAGSLTSCGSCTSDRTYQLGRRCKYLGFAGEEGVRSVGDLDLDERIFNSVYNQRLLGGGAAAGDEHIVI